MKHDPPEIAFIFLSWPTHHAKNTMVWKDFNTATERTPDFWFQIPKPQLGIRACFRLSTGNLFSSSSDVYWTQFLVRLWSKKESSSLMPAKHEILWCSLHCSRKVWVNVTLGLHTCMYSRVRFFRIPSWLLWIVQDIFVQWKNVLGVMFWTCEFRNKLIVSLYKFPREHHLADGRIP